MLQLSVLYFDLNTLLAFKAKNQGRRIITKRLWSNNTTHYKFFVPSEKNVSKFCFGSRSEKNDI